jgi:hypothetical protein
MIPEKIIETEAQKRRTAIAAYMIQEGIKDGSLKTFIDAKVNLQQARAVLYHSLGILHGST